MSKPSLEDSCGSSMGSKKYNRPVKKPNAEPPTISSMRNNSSNRSIDMSYDREDEKEYDFLVVSLGDHSFNQKCQVLRAGLENIGAGLDVGYDVCPEVTSELSFGADKKTLSEESCRLIRDSWVIVLFLGDASLAHEECTLPAKLCALLTKASQEANKTPGCSVVVVYEGKIRPFPTLAIDKTVKYYPEYYGPTEDPEDRRRHRKMFSQLQKQWESSATSHTVDSPLAKSLTRTAAQHSQLEASLSTTGTSDSLAWSIGSSMNSLQISTHLAALTPKVSSIQKMIQESVPKGSPASEWRELTPEEESELTDYITEKAEAPTKNQFRQIRDWIRQNHARNRPPLTTHVMRDFIDNVFGNVGVAQGPINEPGKWDIFVSYTQRVSNRLRSFSNIDVTWNS